jgi:hypothetical protein
MAITYSPIATTTLGSAAADVTFTSISGTYTDLVLVAVTQIGSSGDYLGVQFNSDTGSNYSRTRLSGNGTSASSERDTSQARLNFYAQPTSNFAVNILNIMNYSNTTKFKTVLCRTDQAAFSTNVYAGLYRSTSAITSIKLIGPSNFSTGSTFTLYGIASA